MNLSLQPRRPTSGKSPMRLLMIGIVICVMVFRLLSHRHTNPTLPITWARSGKVPVTAARAKAIMHEKTYRAQ